MIWHSPWGFLAFLPLVFAAWWHFRRTPAAVLFSSNQLLHRVESKQVRLRYHLLFLCRFLTLALVALGLSRPQLVANPGLKQSEGLDIVLAIDTSASMQALDFELQGERHDRLTVVKAVISDFIAKRASDRIGMVVFGSEAFTQAPLTLDHDVLLRFLRHIKIGMAGKATAIGDALAIAVNRLKEVDAKSRIVILLTDGENTAGRIDPMKAAEAAAELGIRVYTIAVGRDGKVPFPVQGFFGQSVQYQEAKVDVALLKKVAAIAGGSFYQASDTETLARIYDEIDKLEKTQLEIKDYRQYREVAYFFFLAALAFLLCEMLLGLTRWRRLPE